MTDDQITDLAKLLSADAAADPPEDRLQLLKEHLMVEYRLETGNDRAPQSTPGRPTRPPRRWRTRHPLLAAVSAGGLLAAVGATALALVLPAGGPAPASPGAVRLLAEVAVAAGRQPAQAVSNSEFMYIRSEVSFAVYNNGGQTPTIEPLHERQIWLPAANVCDYGLLIEQGQRISLAPTSPSQSSTCGPGNLHNATYRLLQSLPANPQTLLNHIESYNQAKGEGQALGSDGEAFVTIGDLIRETIVPPATAATLYRAAALIPGVTLVGRVANADGQPGIAIAWTGDQSRFEWIFNPATFQYIGERDFDLSTGTPVETGNTAVVQRAFVARVGQLP